jgi:ABC-type Fe3+-hydroxamate transport system substrate-binding protein
MNRFYPTLFCIAVVCLTSCGIKQKREPLRKEIQITDMAGRTVNIPEHIASAFGADHTTTFMLQALVPEMLSAWNAAPSSSETAFLSEELKKLPAGSTHSQIFDIAGVRNCAAIDEDFGYKDISINIEQVIKWNPDYIIVNNRSSNQTGNILLSKIKNDKSWQMLDAVKNNHLLVVPTSPKNWIGRPPGINRLLGIRWLEASLYPDIAKTDMQKEVSRFCNLFYHISLSSEQIQNILNEN